MQNASIFINMTRNILKDIIVKYSLLFLFTTTVSCDYLNNLTTESEIISEEIHLGEIKSIEVNAPCKIELFNESSETITIEGHSHLIDELKLKFEDNKLTIDHNWRLILQKSKLITIRIPANNLNSIVTFAVCELETMDTISPYNLLININGDGKFTNANLSINSNHLRLFVWGTRNIGEYRVEGKSVKGSFLLEGCVSIDASDFECDNITVNHKSVKDCYVCPKKDLQVSTYSSGNTYYYGSPAVDNKYVHVPYFSATGNVLSVK